MNYSITTRRIRTTLWKTGTESSVTHTPMTTERTMPHLLHISSHSHWLKLSLARTSHPSPRHTWLSLFDSTYSTLHFPAFLLSVFLFPFFHLSDEQQPELYKKIMENLCDSANNGGEGTYDVFYLPTGYEAQRPCLQRAPEIIGPPLLQDP